MARFVGKITTILAAAALTACVTGQKPPSAPALGLADIAARLPPETGDRDGWARDLAAALKAIDKAPTAERVCASVAVIEQESRFHADPAVPGLPRLVRAELERRLAPLGPLAGPALHVLLAGSAPGETASFGQRLDRVRSEHDLDRLYRDVAAVYQDGYPGPFALASGLSRLLGHGALEDLNPITTVGAMQVKVDYARKLPEMRDLEVSDVRESLYTRKGGVRAGVARLLDYPAGYDDVVYRFADYNAGAYTSRNAAFQAMLAELTGQPLALDGDLLAYQPNGEPQSADSKTLHALLTFGRQHGDWDWRIRHEARAEKSADFEATAIYREVRDAWEKQTGKKASYARLPEITVSSPKMPRPRTTAWFAESVKRHYDACRAR